MGTKDPRIDEYIARSADFAKPVLAHIRKQIHAACPGVEETMKWGMPHFLYRGMLAGMASFKAHCTFGFWKGELIVGGSEPERNAMGQFGRMTSIKDLPPDRTFARYVKQAMKLNEEGVKSPSRSKPRAEPKELVIPPYFTSAVKRSKEAWATFQAFPYSKKKEYVEWIAGAKTEETRERRLETAIEWMEEGKSRMWKYERK